MKEYFVFMGGFGSGKSELAINLALQKATEGACTLVDMDVVNPYFRSTERNDVLSKAGVRLIAPPFAMHKIEIMSLSGEIFAAFVQPDGTAIFDAGGNSVGAISLGQYQPQFNAIPPEDLHVLLVVNPMRPLAETAQKAYELMQDIQRTSRLQVNGLINNANLVDETTEEELHVGYDVVRELSEMTGIPVYATAGAADMLEKFLAYAKEKGLDEKYIGRPMPIGIQMHRTWNKFLKEGL